MVKQVNYAKARVFKGLQGKQSDELSLPMFKIFKNKQVCDLTITTLWDLILPKKPQNQDLDPKPPSDLSNKLRNSSKLRQSQLKPISSDSAPIVNEEVKRFDKPTLEMKILTYCLTNLFSSNIAQISESLAAINDLIYQDESFINDFESPDV